MPMYCDNSAYVSVLVTGTSDSAWGGSRVFPNPSRGICSLVYDNRIALGDRAVGCEGTAPFPHPAL